MGGVEGLVPSISKIGGTPDNCTHERSQGNAGDCPSRRPATPPFS